jgi:hypothetical protein
MKRTPTPRTFLSSIGYAVLTPALLLLTWQLVVFLEGKLSG